MSCTGRVVLGVNCAFSMWVWDVKEPKSPAPVPSLQCADGIAYWCSGYVVVGLVQAVSQGSCSSHPKWLILCPQ